MESRETRANARRTFFVNPSVAVVIVNYNGVAYVAEAIESALAQDYGGSIEVIVVDNASNDGSPEEIRGIPHVRLIENPTNVGFGAAVNVAIRATDADYVALLNPDARAEPHWLSRMIPWMRSHDIDLASSVVAAGSETWFAGGRFFETLGATLVRKEATGETDWISGCALVANRFALNALGGFDEGFFLYYEDVDLSLRARAAGMRLRVLAETLVDHPAHGRSTNTLGRRKAEIGFYARGRLIGKHVTGWKRLPALAFATVLAPLHNGIDRATFVPVAGSLIRGFREARRASNESRNVGTKRPTVGVLLNIFERTSGLGAGGHRHFIEIIRRWDWADIVLFGPQSAREAMLREVPGARYVTLPSLENAGAGKAVDFLFRSAAWVRALPALRRCNVLLSTSHFLPDVVPAICSGRPGVVIIHHIIGVKGAANRTTAIPRLSEEAALLLVRLGARSVLVSSKLVATELRRRSFRMPIRVTSSGVDHVALPSDRVDDKREGALFIGRMHPAKGALDAVRAWRRVVDTEPGAVLTIAGAREVEEYAREVEALVAASGLNANVVIRGRISDTEKISAMMKARLFLFPSHEEGWGIALAEAMRAGLPCVTYALPIFEEIFPQGRLEAPLGDTNALARHVVAILRDESLRSRLSREASALATGFSWASASRIESDAVKAFLAS